MRSVRLRLLLIALLPFVVLLPMLLGVTMARWIERYDDLLIAKVASDLRVAEQYFGRIEATQAAEVSALAQSVGFAQAQAAGQAALSEYLERERKEHELDFLIWGTLTDTGLPEAARQVAMAATPDVPSAHLVLLAGADLKKISQPLAERAAISLVPTEAARPIARDVEQRGMFILAAHRAEDSDAVLIGGRLLNRNLDVIDTMNELIYRDEAGNVSRTGTTTLFLDDVRISTNVRLFEGSRALGTRVSEVVWRHVMEEGQTWLDRAFVVNDWYISGYVPLTDVSGDRIGMLYTGFLQAPFTAQRNTTILTLILAFITVFGLTVPMFLWLARGIFAPLEQMTATMERAEAGALEARIGPVSENSEIGAVARHLDRLLDQVQDRDAALRDYADNLNDLVEQRTEELKEANRKLEATFAQLVISEKLATVGEITAGVAHEINNPVAVIQGNLEIIRMGLTPEQIAELKVELDLIDAQAHRINIIVGKLLNFTRPDELSDITAIVQAQKVVEDSLILVAADLRKHKVKTEVHHKDSPSFRVVETELQQVIVNLAINAAQAMDGGGVLSIQSRSASRGGVAGTEIVVQDTGHGIPAEELDHVFDPFMTTKLGTGSGLGLSISQTLVTRVGGLISVESAKGAGATFFVWFPAVDNSSQTTREPVAKVDILT
ncbi:MAG: cache domain-containing protein [Pseudomonadota bacterium]